MACLLDHVPHRWPYPTNPQDIGLSHGMVTASGPTPELLALPPVPGGHERERSY